MKTKQLFARGLLSLAMCLCFAGQSYAAEGKYVKYEAKSVDVEVYVSALDLIQDNSITPAGDPSYLLQKGARFYVPGLIVPAGTWNICGTNESCWRSKVIGTWHCDAVNPNNINFGDPSFLTLPEIVSTQLFILNGDDSEQISDNQIVGLGSNPPPGGAPVKRAIVGGSGEYAGAQGEQIEVVIGGDGAALIVASFQMRLLIPISTEF